MELVTPGIGLLFWMLLSFSIVLFVLKKFAWKPILQALKNREDTIEGALKAADNARAEMAQLKAYNDKILEETKAERENMIGEARQLKEKMIADARDTSKVEADKIMAKAIAEIENQKNAMINDMKDQIAILSVEIAEKILNETLAHDKKQEKYVADLVDKLKLN